MIKRIWMILAFTILAAGLAMSQSGKWHAYYNKEFKVGFRYPAHWKFAGANRPMDDEASFTSLAEVSPPKTDGTITIGVGKISEAACKVFPASSDPESNKPVTKRVGNITFYHVDNSDVGMGHWEETDIYRTFHDGRCYEVRLMARGLNDPRYHESGGGIIKRLNTILRTLYFGK